MTKLSDKKLTDRQVTVLEYVCENPGASSRQVAVACGMQTETVTRALTSLYARRLVGRQQSLRSLAVAVWFPENVALYAHQRAKELVPNVETQANA